MITVQDIWVIYYNAVGGKAYDGKELPLRFDDMEESAKNGWLAVTRFINANFETIEESFGCCSDGECESC